MKTIFTILLMAVFSFGVNAQFVSIDFETPESDTLWTQFANSGDAAENLTLADNPDMTGINASSFCLKFIVLDTADPWVGAWADLGDMPITADNYMMQMMVYKDVISNCGMKVEGGGDAFELKVPNTVTGMWEMVSFDFTAKIGETHTRLVIFPDFPDTRTAGSTTYMDNIGFVDGSTNVREVNGMYMSVYPNPATDRITVQYPGMTSITISNMIGQTLRTISFDSSYIREVEVSDLEMGIYFVTLNTPDGIVSSRFVKR